MNNRLLKYLFITISVFSRLQILAETYITQPNPISDTLTIENHVVKGLSRDSLKILIDKTLCEGDTASYIEIMQYVPYYDYFVYSIIMADIYQYSPAYYNSYRLFDLWLKLYNSKIDADLKNNLSFWLKLGVDCGNENCKDIVNDTTNTIEEAALKKFDSINNLIFYYPRDTIMKTIYYGYGYGNLKKSMDYYKFIECKKLAINNCDKKCFSTLNLCAYSNNDNGFSVNENFLFRIYECLKYKDYSYVTGGIIWHLQSNTPECFGSNLKSPSIFYTSELGLYLLSIGVKNGDKFSYIPLAELYAKGIGVQQDINYAKEILKNNFSDKVTEKFIKQWLNK